MSRLIDISDERFWQILFEEACVEGQEAERIEKELEKIVSFNLDKVVEELEDYSMWKEFMIYDLTFREREIIKKAIEIVKRGGVNDKARSN